MKLVSRRRADVSLFRSFYEETSDVVYGYARARLPNADAEDVTAEVFHAAAQRARTGETDHLTTAWAIAVTRNKVVDRWRRLARQRDAIAKLQHRAHVDHQVRASTDERVERVLATLDELPSHYRAVLILKYLEGLPVDEIATLLELSLSATESRLARARRALRAAIEQSKES